MQAADAESDIWSMMMHQALAQWFSLNIGDLITADIAMTRDVEMDKTEGGNTIFTGSGIDEDFNWKGTVQIN